MVKGLEIRESVLSNEEYISLINNEIKEYNVITESIDRSFNVLEYLEKNQEKGLDKLATELLNININNIFKETNISSRDIIPAIECFENEHTKQYAVKVSMEGLWSTIKGLFAALMEKIRTIISFFKKWARNGFNALEEKKQEKKIESFSDRLKNIEDYYKDQANREHPIILNIGRDRKIVKAKGIDKLVSNIGASSFDKSLSLFIKDNVLNTLNVFKDVINVIRDSKIEYLITEINNSVKFELEDLPAPDVGKQIKGINNSVDLMNKIELLDTTTFQVINKDVVNIFINKKNIFDSTNRHDVMLKEKELIEKYDPVSIKGNKSDFIGNLNKANVVVIKPGDETVYGVMSHLVKNKSVYRNKRIYILFKFKKFIQVVNYQNVIDEMTNETNYDYCKIIPEIFEIKYIILKENEKTELKKDVEIYTVSDIKNSIGMLREVHSDIFKNFKSNINASINNFEKTNKIAKSVFDILDTVEDINKTMTFDAKYYITFLRSYFSNTRQSISSLISLNNLCINYSDDIASSAFSDLGSIINKNLEIYEEAMKFDSWVEYYNSFEKA